MPQMAPMNWALLFLIFLGTLMVLLSKVYFYKSMNTLIADPINPSQTNTQSKSWAW